MRKRPEIVALVLLVVLMAYAAGLHVFVIPVVQNMMASANAGFTLPSRIAIVISQNAYGEFLLFVALLAFALKRTKPTDDRAQQARVLNLASLVVSVFIVLQGWMFVDMAVAAHVIVNPQVRKTASINPLMPVGMRASTR